VRDLERGVMDSISEDPWQTDTSIGDWYYRTGQAYKTGPELIQMLVDIVSKNGNLLLNIVQTPEGDLEPDILSILEEIAVWTSANGEGIYGTRPWKIYGEGPSTSKNQPKGQFGGLSDVRPYESTDIRFTTKGDTLYAFSLNTPANSIIINSLGKNSELMESKLKSISMLGSEEKLSWKQESESLVIDLPSKLPDWNVIGLRIILK
jgi:alpha-L-fucosidase